MRIVVISDSHTRKQTYKVLSYLKKKSWKIDLILLNGDLLGVNEIRDGYGHGYNKKLFLAGLDRTAMLAEISDIDFSDFKAYYEQGYSDESREIEFAKQIKQYIEERYEYLAKTVNAFSEISKTYFNLGVYESPLHYKALSELAFLLDMDESFIRKVAMLTDYRDIFKSFPAKLSNKASYIGGSTKIIGTTLVAGIPGLNPSSGSSDSVSEFQERMIKDLIKTVQRRLSYAKRLIILSPIQGKLRRDPFTFRPGSLAVRKFIESMRGKLRQKIFIQSYYHMMTTHFYTATEFHFMLNNASVNNGLFNMLDVGRDITCFDVDPNIDKVRRLKTYNYNLAEYDSPHQRLSLNYEDADSVVEERNIKGCYYM